MRIPACSAACLSLAVLLVGVSAADNERPSAALNTEVRQITSGPNHHFFGYIGHVRTIPWNRGGRYILSLRTSFQDRMPKPGEAADIVLLDAQQNYAPRVVDRTRAWNFQQGTMFYWNPQAPETQFFFNDRDPETHEVFCVLFDISKGKGGERVAEYRFKDSPIGNSGMAQRGGWFLGLNYGRLARLRSVTGYPGARDWTLGGKIHPEDDGIFKVNSATKEKQLLVSFKQLAAAVREKRPDVAEKELFINHTLWSRDDGRIFFFVRGDWGQKDGKHLDIPFTMKADGSELRPLARHIGGHPEWESDRTLIGAAGKDQVLFDVEKQDISGKLGTPTIFPSPGGDVALSPNGTWLVNGHSEQGKNYLTFLRRADGAWTRTAAFERGAYTTGDLRIDPAPCWDRDGSRLLVGAAAQDGSRQLFIVTLKTAAKP
ncbi:MAG: hypothetical protein JNM56_20425 [Planctomycetia bacterium]|nr:hypothetical protein [Planctomycetia bacterium]